LGPIPIVFISLPSEATAGGKMRTIPAKKVSISSCSRSSMRPAGKPHLTSTNDRPIPNIVHVKAISLEDELKGYA
jgi:hypothetical protein